MNPFRWLFLLAFTGAASSSWAGDIAMRGFASFVGGQTSSSDEVMEDEGYDVNFDFKPESLMALQFDADLGDKLSGTLQLIAEGQNDYDFRASWAYLTYEFNDAIQASAGRIQIPFYRYSDFLDVRYAYNWVTAPQAVYGVGSLFSGFDGMSVVFSNDLGGIDSTLQIIYGQVENDLGEAQADIEHMHALSWTLVRDWLTFRVGYVGSQSKIVIPEYTNLSNLVLGVGAGAVGGGADVTMEEFQAVSDAILIDGDRGSFYGAALGVDYNNIVLDMEITEYEIEDSLLPGATAFYLSAGYRFGSFLPYITYSELDAEVDSNVISLIPEAVANTPIAELGGATLPQAFAGAIAQSKEETEATELGFRYDFHHSAAFKMSVLQQETIDGEKVTLVRSGIDLVF